MTYSVGHAAGIGEASGYRGDGLRAYKGDASGRTYYLYDGSGPVCELDASANVAAENMFGANGLVSRNTPSGGTTWYAFDERGNVSQRVGSNGALLSTDVYDGFGNKRAGPADVFGFGGQAGYYTDTETGLILCTHRHYDPQQGRFLTRDPLGYGGGINLYSYTANNPVNRLDPEGLATITVNFKPLMGAVGPYHGYLVITDTNAAHTQYFIRGGPSGDPPWGTPIIVNSKYFVPGSVDYPAPGEVDPSVVLIKDNKPASFYLNKLGQEKYRINSQKSWYLPTNNSNTVASDLIMSLGVKPPQLVGDYPIMGVWAPGWSNGWYTDPFSRCEL